ncbi:MAG: TonB-dependent receptor plug domain-containing protein [Butyricimonas paravirosa]
MVLVVNFIGMVSQEIPVTRDVNLKIVLKMADTALDDVVVNGFYTKNKNTFTGSVTTVKGEELVQASSTNLIQALSTLVPGLRIVENNAQGSNPNAGRRLLSGDHPLMTSDEAGINTPLIILMESKSRLKNSTIWIVRYRECERTGRCSRKLFLVNGLPMAGSWWNGSREG